MCYIIYTNDNVQVMQLENKLAITSEPDIVSIELDGTEDYVVLTCDGIWDVI